MFGGCTLLLDPTVLNTGEGVDIYTFWILDNSGSPIPPVSYFLLIDTFTIHAQNMERRKIINQQCGEFSK